MSRASWKMSLPTDEAKYIDVIATKATTYCEISKSESEENRSRDTVKGR